MTKIKNIAKIRRLEFQINEMLKPKLDLVPNSSLGSNIKKAIASRKKAIEYLKTQDKLVPWEEIHKKFGFNFHSLGSSL